PRPHHYASRPYSDELEELHGMRLDTMLAGRGLIVDDASRKNLLTAVQRAVKQATRVAVAEKVDGGDELRRLFVLAGALMNATSISRRLIGFCLSLVGFIRGGLAMVSIVASMIFAEISGSSVADVAAL